MTFGRSCSILDVTEDSRESISNSDCLLTVDTQDLMRTLQPEKLPVDYIQHDLGHRIQIQIKYKVYILNK